MRRRRPVHTPPPGYALALPRDGQGCEVQVRPQSEHDRFLIETDDAMVSPMIVSNPVFQQQQQQQQQQHPASNSSSSSSAPGMTPLQQQQAQTSSSGSGGGNAAKFIHLNNTNLFVLMDGVSMFVEGKSTFTGNDDALLLQQQLQSRRSMAQLGNSATSSGNSSSKSGDGGSRARGGGGGNNKGGGGGAAASATAVAPARRVCGGGGGKSTSSACANNTTAVVSSDNEESSGSAGEGSVEDVIRDIEQNDTATTAAAVAGASMLTSSESTSSLATSSGSSSSTSRSAQQPQPAVTAAPAAAAAAAAAATPMPNAFAALFARATRPSTAPLFGHCAATSAANAAATAATARKDGGVDAHEQHVVSAAAATTAAASAATVLTTVTSARPGASAPQTHAAMTGSGGSNGSAATRRNGGASVTTASAAAAATTTSAVAAAQERLRRPLSVHDIGSSNRSLDLNDVEVLNYIGGGSQGKVYRVRLDGKLYALKCMDVAAAMQATNAVERQGRKRGLVKELNMICMQRGRPAPPKYLMQMFNAVVSLVGTRKQLSVLSELMSFSVEDAQCMVARIPPNELSKIAQAVFGDLLLKYNNSSGSSHSSGGNSSNSHYNHHSSSSSSSTVAEERRLWQELGSCMHLLGRSAFDVPEEWEKRVDRQTALPEVVLSMLAADVLRGLKELHEDYDTVHCDLKPGNVLLNFERMRFKLADFGCGCAMDAQTRLVHRSGVDLGSKLYKAPERLTDSVADIPALASAATSEQAVVTFTAKADVWSLGIMLLELSAGVHPCSLFKSNYWNYINLLKLPRMVKPLTWSFVFFDFVVRCVRVDVATRWSVDALLQHPFIRKYDSVPRSKLKRFMERLQSESATFQRKQQMALLQKQILLSTANQAKDNYQKQSRNKWRTFTGFLKEAPAIQDTTKFPPLLP